MLKKLLIISGLLCSFSLYAAPVNINSANAKVLAKSLSGIGIVKAKAIVQYREAHGAFSSAKDLIKVKGVSRKIVNQNMKDILLTDG